MTRKHIPRFPLLRRSIACGCGGGKRNAGVNVIFKASPMGKLSSEARLMRAAPQRLYGGTSSGASRHLPQGGRLEKAKLYTLHRQPLSRYAATKGVSSRRPNQRFGRSLNLPPRGRLEKANYLPCTINPPGASRHPPLHREGMRAALHLPPTSIQRGSAEREACATKV